MSFPLVEQRVALRMRISRYTLYSIHFVLNR